MEIDLERAKRALAHLGAAMEEARRVVRPGPDGLVRVHTDDQVMALGVGWAAVGFAAVLLAAELSGRARSEREGKPLGIGYEEIGDREDLPGPAHGPRAFLGLPGVRDRPALRRRGGRRDHAPRHVPPGAGP